MNKEEIMLPVLLMGLVGFAILTIISLLLFLSRLYVYYKCKNNFIQREVVVKEKKESKQENIEKEVKASRKERSGYYYSGEGKLFPDDKGFVENDTWSLFLINLYKEDKLNRIKRSDYFYKGKDKLYPFDEFFFDNISWNSKRINKYKKEFVFNSFKKNFLRKNSDSENFL